MTTKLYKVEIKNAIISGAALTTSDRGLLSSWIHLDYGGSGQGFGGYALYLPKSFAHHQKDSSYAGHWIFRCMEVAGVENWDELKGKTIRVQIGSDGLIQGIGHIVKDDWFFPKTDFGTK